MGAGMENFIDKKILITFLEVVIADSNSIGRSAISLAKLLIEKIKQGDLDDTLPIL